MRRREDDFAAWRRRRENQEHPFSYVYPDMPPRFRRCRAFARALFEVEWGSYFAVFLEGAAVGVLMGAAVLLRGGGALWESGIAFLAAPLALFLPLGFLARWLRHTARLFWRCPCCGQPFPYYVPDGRHEEMREKECCYALRQMRIRYVKTRLCPLVVPSECPSCRRKFFEIEDDASVQEDSRRG